MSITESTTEQAGYEASFDQLLAQLKSDPSALEAFLANPRPALEAAGIPVDAEYPGPGAASVQLGAVGVRSAGTDFQMTGTSSWWGITLVMNEDLTQAILDASIASGPLGALTTAALVEAGVTVGAGPVGSACAMAFALKLFQIKAVDKGNGVYWPISWVQWAAVAASVPLGPTGILTALMAFVHPLGN